MGRGQYDRHAARMRREAALSAPVVPVPPVEAPVPLPEPEAPIVVTHDETETSELPDRPVRLLEAHGYIEERFGRGVFQWRAGEVLTNPDEIAHLASRGVRMEPV